MGLQKTLSKDGQVYAYHKIGGIEIDEVNNRASATMYNYASKSYRDSEPGGYRSREIRKFPLRGTLAGYKAMSHDDLKEALYALFKVSQMRVPPYMNPETAQPVEMNFYADAIDVLEQI